MTSGTARPSGRQHTISAGPYQATVVEVSGGLRTMTHDGLPVLDGYGEDEMCGGARGQLLVPWPNRVDHGRYTFAGEERQLDITEPARDRVRDAKRERDTALRATAKARRAEDEARAKLEALDAK